MAYSSDIAKTLSEQLTRLVTLDRHQLAGQVTNLDFWMAEVRHCFDVIDGYGRRFIRLKNGQAQHVAEHHTIEFDLWDPC